MIITGTKHVEARYVTAKSLAYRRQKFLRHTNFLPKNGRSVLPHWSSSSMSRQELITSNKLFNDTLLLPIGRSFHFNCHQKCSSNTSINFVRWIAYYFITERLFLLKYILEAFAIKVFIETSQISHLRWLEWALTTEMHDFRYKCASLLVNEVLHVDWNSLFLCIYSRVKSIIWVN